MMLIWIQHREDNMDHMYHMKPLVPPFLQALARHARISDLFRNCGISWDKRLGPKVRQFFVGWTWWNFLDVICVTNKNVTYCEQKS